MEFGRRATTILIAGQAPSSGIQPAPDLVTPNLMEAAREITARDP